MRIVTFAGVSLGCSVAIAAALSYHVERHAAAAGFWQNDPMGIAWAAAGGPWGILIIGFVVFSFVLVTGGALGELAVARKRLAEAAWQPLELDAQALFADTDFAAIAGQPGRLDRGAAPLALLRTLRAELWRVYIKRLLATQTVTLALLAADLVLSQYPALIAIPELVTGARWQQFGATLLVALAAMSWLALDNAIARVTTAATQLFAASQPAPADEMRPGMATRDAAPRGLVELATAVNQLVTELSARPAAGLEAGGRGGERLGPRLDTIGSTLRETASAQQMALERMAEATTAQTAELSRWTAQRSSSEVDTDKLGLALSELATAVDKLADPVMRRIKLLGATDRRLLAVLQRQEEVVAHFGNRWNELVAALQAMSARLESFAQAAARLERDPRLLPGGGDTGITVGAAELGGELQELLDEMSDYGLSALESATKPADS